MLFASRSTFLGPLVGTLQKGRGGVVKKVRRVLRMGPKSASADRFTGR
ncbi:hypothetical protein [Aphanizomenon phage Yong-DA]|nr:hypothetical protein [Aphanizomenon phage Yong-DA]